MSLYFGATALGIKLKDSVVVASDRRMSYGVFIMSRNAKKVFLLDNKIAIAFSGLYGDLRGIYRILEAEFRYMEHVIGHKPPVYAMAKRLSLLLYSYKAVPFMVEALVAGLDVNNVPRLYVLDALGSITEEPFAAVGSGATLALGYLEENYREDMSVEEAMDLAAKAMRISMERDPSTGDGIDVVAITPEGVKEKTIRVKVVTE
ncbi:MAG: proteasome subunit beta [Desulfurococcales archaeon]|nr:proteasome subunit beta [Desulfurococcales archaeon]